jgi:hypothetical protein
MMTACWKTNTNASLRKQASYLEQDPLILNSTSMKTLQLEAQLHAPKKYMRLPNWPMLISL